MQKRPKTASAPASLSAEARELWDATLAEFVFQPGVDLTLLREMCQALDRLRQVQRELKTAGLMVPAPGGTLKANPLLSIESQLRRDILACTRALRLSSSPEV